MAVGAQQLRLLNHNQPAMKHAVVPTSPAADLNERYD